MASSLPKLDARLDALGVDAYLVDADGDDSTQHYLSGYRAPDDFVSLYVDGEVTVLVSGLEYTRAKTDSDAAVVRKLAEFGYREKATEVDPRTAWKLVTAAFVADEGVESVLVPGSFPVSTADVLREHGVEVVWDDEYVMGAVRAVKRGREVEHVRATQAANADAMAVAEGMLADATVADGVLQYEGDVLTSERVRERIEVELLESGCGMDDCIVACGPAAARAHDSGSGPLAPGVPVVVDVFPFDRETRYFGDMTRTFVKDDPEDWVVEWYDLAVEAYEAALDVLEPGVTGEVVHDAVCDVFETAGFPTVRTDEATENGFFHSTGHGVGLDVHEPPYLASGGGELEPGHVVTVEPGLYEQGRGGVRVEDLVVVTEDGYENLTDYPNDLRVV